MFNKNAFAVTISGASTLVQYPPPGEKVSASLPCHIDKKNLDAKNPPKNPFMVQVAMRSSLDVFYFSVHCFLHCLIDFKSPMTKDEFKKFWEMIPKANESTFVV
mmetsp:Transcript_45836/g.33575  ORF Transcript_45836/g.33575 Transcript_45836/m.33575 type:complete len:104 (+) Transcript_45836:2418-2729(+)